MGSLPEVVDDSFLYPNARRDETVVDSYHGVAVSDPYRWLEDSVSNEAKQFLVEQQEVTEQLLETCETREKLRKSISSLNDRPRYTRPFRRGNKYFYFHNSGLQAQNVLYMQEGIDGKPEVLFDPNAISKDGSVALKFHKVSANADFLAVGLTSKGSDWVNIKIVRIADRRMEPDTVSWVKFSHIAWTADSRGFFYSRYPPPINSGILEEGTENNINLNHQVYYHFLGNDQSEDILCWKDPEHPKWMFGTTVTEDGKYIILYIHNGCHSTNMLYYCNIDSLSNGLEGFKGKQSMLPFKKLIDKFEAQYHLVVNRDSFFTLRTNKDAPKYKLVQVNIQNLESWKDVVEESGSDTLVSANGVSNDKLLVCYLRDVKSVLQLRDLETGQLIQNLPIDIGTVSAISARLQDHVAFINFKNFLTPSIIYKCDLNASKPVLEVFRESVPRHFDRNEFQTKQVFVPTTDGTKIPMFIVSNRNLNLDGQNPTLLYGYGGFNVSITPSFNNAWIVMAKHLGLVCAIANIRGGGEYGQEWHKSGSFMNKQNCFNDFIACSEFLIKEGYTQPKKLCIEGISNGGLLVAACVNQRPDLFGCILAQSGVMDMLRFPKFTIGHAWITDYGNPDNEDEFQKLIKYSPLHNIRRPWEMAGTEHSQYPATMLLTADHDDRVVPLHSMKLAATMQFVLCKSLKRSLQTNPIILRVETKCGHGSGSPTQKRIDRAVDKYSFMAKMLGASWIN